MTVVAQNNESGVLGRNALVEVTEAIQLKSFQEIVMVTIPNVANYVIELPPVSEAAGKIYTFYVRSRSTYTATISSPDNALAWSDGTLDAAAEACTLYSNGIWWSALSYSTGVF